jgi:hypothetical protein
MKNSWSAGETINKKQGRGAPILGWWASADNGSSAWVIVGLVSLLVIRELLGVVGVDRLSTVSSYRTWASDAITALGGLVGIIAAARSWFGPTRSEKAFGSLGHLMNDRFPVWVLVGIFFAALAGLIAAWSCMGLIGVVAQHTNGKAGRFNGIVVSNRATQTPAGICRQELAIREEGSRQNIDVCVRIGADTQLLGFTPSDRDRVIVFVSDNAFGRVVTRILSSGPLPPKRQ